MADQGNRTQLAQYGFQDQDRKEPLHDLACEYLAQPEHHVRLAEVTGLFQAHRRVKGEDGLVFEEAVLPKTARREVPVHDGRFTLGFLDVLVPYDVRVTALDAPQEDAGYGRWTMVGFPATTRAVKDGALTSDLSWTAHDGGATREGPLERWGRGSRLETYKGEISGPVFWEAHQLARVVSRHIAIEVKVRVNIADTLRQLEFYRQGEGRGYAWVLATPEALSPEQRAPFTRNGVTVVRLGDAFHEWVKNRSAPSEPAPEF